MDLTVKKQVTNAHNLTTTVTSNWQAPPDQLIGLWNKYWRRNIGCYVEDAFSSSSCMSCRRSFAASLSSLIPSICKSITTFKLIQACQTSNFPVSQIHIMAVKQIQELQTLQRIPSFTLKTLCPTKLPR